MHIFIWSGEVHLCILLCKCYRDDEYFVFQHIFINFIKLSIAQTPVQVSFNILGLGLGLGKFALHQISLMEGKLLSSSLSHGCLTFDVLGKSLTLPPFLGRYNKNKATASS